MKKDFTKIACVLDRSGSMGQDGKINEARNGFNEFLKDQKALPGEASLTVTIFDNKIDTIYSGDIEGFEGLTTGNFSPRGMTSLFDAIGTTITVVGEELAAMDEADRPEKVLVVIITDGLENNSSEYSKARIVEMIEHQRSQYNWEFLFMGADEASIQEAQSFGVVNNVQYENSGVGVRKAYTSVSCMATQYRSTGSLSEE